MSGASGDFTIVHPTDFSETSAVAFAHALKLARLARGRLILLHVQTPGNKESVQLWDRFPPIRQTLDNWGLLKQTAWRSIAKDGLQVEAQKLNISKKSVAEGIADFAREHKADVLVFGTHGQDGLDRWASDSVTEHVADRLRIPTLFVSRHGRGFVEQETGALHLSKILVPVDWHPDPTPVVGDLEDILRRLGVETVTLAFVHVGTNPPPIPAIYIGQRRSQMNVQTVAGPLFEAILAAAQDADLMVMPTEGRHGFLDAVRGSTTERIVKHAPCPILAIPTIDA